MTNLLIALASLAGIILVFRLHAIRMSAKRNAEWDYLRNENAPQESKPETAAVNQLTLDHSAINRAWRIGDMHFSRGDFEEAEKWFIKVLALNEQHTESLNRLGVIYIQHGNPKRAEILYQKIFTVTQKEPSYYCNYGRCLYNQGRLAEAVEAYENAVKLDATRPARFVSIGQIYYEQKNFMKALVYFLRAIELDPKNTEYLLVAAELAALVGDMERVHKSLKKVLEIDPYNAVAKEKLNSMGQI